MMRELVIGKDGRPCLREYVEEELLPGHVRVGTLYGSPKHGTELTSLRENPFGEFFYDEKEHIFKRRGVPVPDELPGLGNMWVGIILETGPGVSYWETGQRVAGYGILRDTHTIHESKLLYMPESMPWQAALCFDPLQFALGGIRDAGVRLGDRVLISGLGAIGLMAAQAARAAGASFVAVSDPIPKRREAALENGADMAWDPLSDDFGLAIREYTGGRGADAVIETSADYRALEGGLRALAYGGTLASVGWFKEREVRLHLGREGHFNQQNIVFSRACSDPNNDHPRWDFARIKSEAWEMLSRGLFSCGNIITPTVPFGESAAAYRKYVMEPSRQCIKLGVAFGGAK